jgi:RNA recognition motif-containing protein
MNIRVSNLSLNTIDADLRKLFSEYGEVVSASVVRSNTNGRSQGTAIIDMVNDTHASQAIINLNSKMVDGKKISVSEIEYTPNRYKN